MKYSQIRSSYVRNRIKRSSWTKARAGGVFILWIVIPLGVGYHFYRKRDI